MNEPPFITARLGALRAPLTYSFSVQGQTLDQLGVAASAKAVALLGDVTVFEFVSFDVRARTNLAIGDDIAYEADVMVRAL